MPIRSCFRTGVSVLLALHFSLALAECAQSKEVDSKSIDDTSNSQQKSSAKKAKLDADTKAEESKEKADTSQSTTKDLSKIPPIYRIELDKKTYKWINQGRWKEATSRLEKLTQKDKSYSRNAVWLAFGYMFFNQKDKLDAFSKRLEVEDNPHSKTYKMLVDAFSLVNNGKKKEAAKLLESLPSEHDNDAMINYCIAAIAGKNGKTNQAVEFLKRSIELDPNFAWALRGLGYLEFKWIGNKELARKYLSKALEIEPNNNEVRGILMRIMLERNDFDAAIEVAKDAIDLDKKNALNHLNLASIYKRQWRFREASAEMDRAIKLEPEVAVYYRTRAGIKLAQGDMKAAIADQTRAVALSKSKSFDLIALAKMNMKNGDTEAAIANLKEALESEPKSKAAHQQLAAILYENKRWDDLILELKRITTIFPKHSNLQFDLAQVYMQAKKYDLAIAAYTKASNLNPKDPRPLRQLGTYYSEQKEYTKAIKAFRKALNINPTSVQDMVALGYCFAQDDNYRQSEAAFVTALALKQLTKQNDSLPPSRADIIRTLASLLLIEGRYADARNQFESLYSMTRGTKAKLIDAFLLSEANALSSRSDKDVKLMVQSFNKLSAKEKSDYRYSFIQALIKLEKLDFATSEFAKVKDQDFKSEPKWNILSARLQRALGEYDTALGTIDKALAESKKREKNESSLVADALVEKARIQLSKGQTAEAELTANHALETYTKSFASYVVLAKVKFKTGKYKDCIDLLQKALEQNPYLTDAYLLIGDSYMELDDAKSAVDNYVKACEIYPGYVKAHKSLLKAYQKMGKTELAEKEQYQIKNMIESK